MPAGPGAAGAALSQDQARILQQSALPPRASVSYSLRVVRAARARPRSSEGNPQCRRSISMARTPYWTPPARCRCCGPCAMWPT
ncbi:Uncharacterised protein [Bordetella pertussis]|nr:Uncharacterised protein [Bordetella pertussis]